MMAPPSASAPPHSEEAERALLGSILMDPYRVLDLLQKSYHLEPLAFYSPVHATVFAELQNMAVKDRCVIDVMTVAQWLRDKKLLDEVGGAAFIERLVDDTPTAAHAEYYAQIVRDKWQLRQVRDKAIEIRRAVEEGVEKPDEFIRQRSDDIAKILKDSRRDPTNEQRLEKMLARWREAKRRREAGEPMVLAGLPSPWDGLDEMTSGLQPGVYVIGARPSEGKTTAEDMISVELAKQGVVVGRVAVDMAADWVISRGACREAGVSLPKLEKGYAGESQLAAVEEYRGNLKRLPMFMNPHDRDIKAICTWARARHKLDGMQILTIDFFQMLSHASSSGGKYMNRNEELTYVSAALKGLAVSELGIPIIVLSQLSRASKKESRIPELDDLRDCGSLEQDATFVMFLYRHFECDKLPEKMAPWCKEALQANRRPVYAHVRKQQNGPTGRLQWWLHEHYFKFVEAPNGFQKAEGGE